MIGFPWSLYSHTILLWTKENQKFKKIICHVNVLWILTNEKIFSKIISQLEFDYGLFIYPDLSSLATFLRVHSNSKEVSYLSWQNKYPNLKTTCHIKLKLFLWIKLLENLLHAKHLISVTAPLKCIFSSKIMLLWCLTKHIVIQDQMIKCGSFDLTFWIGSDVRK